MSAINEENYAKMAQYVQSLGTTIDGFQMKVKDSTVAPLMSDCLTSSVDGKKWFSKVDLRDGVFNVRIVPRDQEKTAFRTKYGTFEYKLVPFGLCNSPATFTKMMNRILGDLVDVYVTINIDDILIYSNCIKDHTRHVDEVLRRLRENKLFVKREKFLLYQKSVTFCGSTIDGVGIKPTIDSQTEIEIITRPTNVKEVQSFLGSLNYFRQFIESFAILSTPLYILTKKDTLWQWTSEHENAFIQLKGCLTSAPTLHHFDADKETVIFTDASLYAIGGGIGQRYGSAVMPVAYWSKKLNPAETRYPTHERELMALVKICDNFQH